MPTDPAAIALAALGWVLGEPARAQRFLDLTGLTPDDLRARIGAAEIHRAVLEYLAGHEADLTAAADALGLPPETIARARGEFAQ